MPQENTHFIEKKRCGFSFFESIAVFSFYVKQIGYWYFLEALLGQSETIQLI